MRPSTIEKLRDMWSADTRAAEKTFDRLTIKHHDVSEIHKTTAAAVKLATELRLPLENFSHAGMGMFAVSATVSPGQAFEWLDERNKNNRTETPAHITAMADDMKSGRWSLTHQSIAFDLRDGSLIDGQNRLAAIIEAWMPVPMLISIYDVLEAKANVDTGRSRRFRDQMKVVYGEDIDVLLQGLIRAYLIGAGVQHLVLSHGAMREQLIAHKEPLDFATSMFPTRIKGITRSPVLAAIARAWHHVDRAKLTRFCEVLKTSVASTETPEEVTIIALRSFLVSNPSGAGNRAFAAEIYSKTQWAIERYLSGKAYQKALSASRDLYPIPVEKVLR